MEEGHDENIWRRKIFGAERRRRTEMERAEIFVDGPYLVTPTNWTNIVQTAFTIEGRYLQFLNM